MENHETYGQSKTNLQLTNNQPSVDRTPQGGQGAYVSVGCWRAVIYAMGRRGVTEGGPSRLRAFTRGHDPSTNGCGEKCAANRGHAEILVER